MLDDVRGRPVSWSWSRAQSDSIGTRRMDRARSTGTSASSATRNSWMWPCGLSRSAERSSKSAVKVFAANAINAIVLDYRTPFDGKDFVSGRSSTLEALTDIDPFLPLVLTRKPEAELDHATSLMADLVLTHPVEPSALLEAIDMLLVETLKERVHRKSSDLAIYR